MITTTRPKRNTEMFWNLLFCLRCRRCWQRPCCWLLLVVVGLVSPDDLHGQARAGESSLASKEMHAGAGYDPVLTRIYLYLHRYAYTIILYVVLSLQERWIEMEGGYYIDTCHSTTTTTLYDGDDYLLRVLRCWSGPLPWGERSHCWPGDAAKRKVVREKA